MAWLSIYIYTKPKPNPGRTGRDRYVCRIEFSSMSDCRKPNRKIDKKAAVNKCVLRLRDSWEMKMCGDTARVSFPSESVDLSVTTDTSITDSSPPHWPMMYRLLEQRRHPSSRLQPLRREQEVTTGDQSLDARAVHKIHYSTLSRQKLCCVHYLALSTLASSLRSHWPPIWTGLNRMKCHIPE